LGGQGFAENSKGGFLIIHNSRHDTNLGLPGNQGIRTDHENQIAHPPLVSAYLLSIGNRLPRGQLSIPVRWRTGLQYRRSDHQRYYPDHLLYVFARGHFAGPYCLPDPDGDQRYRLWLRWCDSSHYQLLPNWAGGLCFVCGLVHCYPFQRLRRGV